MTFLNQRRNTQKRKSIRLALFVSVLVIFYYSWLPDGNLVKETYLPLWLRDWSNYYFNLRTAIPFVAIGFFAGNVGGHFWLKENHQNKRD